MPLMKSSLASELEKVFNEKPAVSPEAALRWAQAYVNYAAKALTSVSSLPITAPANMGILVGAFTVAFNSLAVQAAAAVMAQGVMAFWQAMVWVGPTAAGTSISPGNASLAGALGAIFSDLSEKSAGDKASELADAFDAGAKLVIVSDVLFVQPAPPVVGPIQ
jgi:hypothetical protein